MFRKYSQFIETIKIATGVNFDMDNNGFSEQSGWVNPDDGLLALDRDGDGLITDGTELFGDQTILQNGNRAANGFQALAEPPTLAGYLTCKGTAPPTPCTRPCCGIPVDMRMGMVLKKRG